MITARANTVGFLLGLGTIAAIAGIACIPHCDAVAYLLLPGVGIAALLFPQGIHGDAPFLFLTLAAVLDILIFSIPFILIVRTRARRELAILLVSCALLSHVTCGCKSTPAPTPAPAQPTVTKSTYPTRPTVAPPTFKVFHTTDSSITLVTDANATDDQVAAILWQLHDAAHNNTFAALDIPQQFVDKRDPMIWFHIYRGPKCASEKYTSGAFPCGASYHAAGDYTLGSF